MLAYRHVKPSRCAYGANATTDEEGTFQFVSLFDEVTSAYVLAVHDVASSAAAPLFIGSLVVSQGQLGSNPVQGQPVVSNRQAMAGQVSQGEIATLPTAGLFLPQTGLAAANAQGGSMWPHEFPLIVLTPGWSLTAYSATQDGPFNVSFWWQVLTPEELDELYGIEIDIG